ncbi:hypothetical protein WG66_001705 [Moniliophthora roreri]|nr:hypothetical protein WG66_001705 [Moniliophthora roreri]
MPNSAVALQMFSTVGSLLPPFMFLPLSCSVVFYGCAPSNITPMPHCYSSSQHPTLPNYHPTSSCIQCSAASLEPKPSLLSLESSESVFQLVEPPEAPFLMFFPSCGRLVGTVTWAGNKEVTVLIGSVVLIPPEPEGTEDIYTPP